MKKPILLILLSLIVLSEIFSQSCLPDGISFNAQSQIDNFQSNYPGCTRIEGDVNIQSYTITNLHGLSSITSIGETLFIQGNKLLKNLDGLENLDSIGESLVISFGYEGYGNLSLQNIQGLGGLDFVGRGIRIGHNDSLIDLSGLENIDTANLNVRIDENARMQSLKGLENLRHINGNLTIEWNNSLATLSHLSNLSSINGMFYIAYNTTLKSLEGLDNIDSESIVEIWIMGNDSLSFCEINSVCGYLADSSNTIAGIWENSSGCNSRTEVEEACTVGYEIEPDFNGGITIYPNPATNTISIFSESESNFNKIVIYNQLGREVFNTTERNDRIDVSKLGQGLYVIELNTNKLKIRRKLIIK